MWFSTCLAAFGLFSHICPSLVSWLEVRALAKNSGWNALQVYAQ